jgi:putative protease
MAVVELKNRFFAGDDLELLSPDGVHPFRPEKMFLKETGEEVTTYGVAGTQLLMAFPFSVSEGDILRGPARNHATS